MMINAATESAFERIAERTADVQRAFTPGAAPLFGDAGAPPTSRPVLDPLSVSAPPDAYFVTTDDRGRTAYTQNGSFSVNEGVLSEADGKPVLGFARDGSAASELHCDAVDTALGRVKNPRVEVDGTFAYDRVSVDPRTGARETERVAVGRIALARFSAGTRLNVAGADRYLAPAGIAPHVGRPGDGNFAHVTPMSRANSRIDFERSLDRLEEAYVSFDAIQAAHKAQGSFGKTSMDLLK